MDIGDPSGRNYKKIGGKEMVREEVLKYSELMEDMAEVLDGKERENAGTLRAILGKARSLPSGSTVSLETNEKNIMERVFHLARPTVVENFPTDARKAVLGIAEAICLATQDSPYRRAVKQLIVDLHSAKDGEDVELKDQRSTAALLSILHKGGANEN